MDNGILDFCNKRKEQIESKPEKDNISFILAYRESHSMFYSPHGPIRLIVLDEEDIQRLYEKYSKRLSKEMQDNIEAVKKAYGE